MPRCLPTISDVVAACIDRLAGATIERMTSELKTVATILEAMGLPDLAETDPATVAIMDVLRRPDDRRSSWGQLMALVAVLSYHRGDMPTMRTDQMPVIRRFYAQEPARHTKYESMYYDMLGEAKRLHGTLRALDKLGHKEIADEMEKQPLSGGYRALTNANERLRDINAEMREVRRDAKLTPDEKRGKMDALTMARNALLKSVVQESKAAQQGAK